MLIDTNMMITITEANQNFSAATRLADQMGKAVLMKNNRPAYILIPVREDGEHMIPRKIIIESADKLLKKYHDDFMEMTK